MRDKVNMKRLEDEGVVSGYRVHDALLCPPCARMRYRPEMLSALAEAEQLKAVTSYEVGVMHDAGISCACALCHREMEDEFKTA